jgi:hypothetical protein
VLISSPSCEASAFCDSSEMPGYLQVLRAVEDYFLSGVGDTTKKVSWTSLPPLYFQFPGRHIKALVELNAKILQGTR